MPPTQRRPAIAVIDELLRDPQQFGFFQAIRLMDRWMAPVSAGGQGLSKLNFRNSVSLAFPASEIESLTVHWRGSVIGEPGRSSGAVLAEDAVWDRDLPPRTPSNPESVERIDVVPACMGMLGVTGAMPLFYTETLAQRELYQKDRAARAFIDVFSHRAVSLFYEAWRKHRLPIQYEADARDRFLPLVLALGGVGRKGARDGLREAPGAMPEEALAFFAGALQQRTTSARQLQQVLQGYLHVPVHIDQFVGRWYELPESGKAHLGLRASCGGTNAVLGRSAMLGDRVWQRDLRMRVVLGPLNHQRFQRFLPGGKGALALKELLTVMGGVSLEYEVQLKLHQSDVRGCALASDRAPASGRLGWDTFLQTRPANDDRADVRYDIHAAA